MAGVLILPGLEPPDSVPPLESVKKEEFESLPPFVPPETKYEAPHPANITPEDAKPDIKPNNKIPESKRQQRQKRKEPPQPTTKDETDDMNTSEDGTTSSSYKPVIDKRGRDNKDAPLSTSVTNRELLVLPVGVDEKSDFASLWRLGVQLTGMMDYSRVTQVFGVDTRTYATIMQTTGGLLNKELNLNPSSYDRIYELTALMYSNLPGADGCIQKAMNTFSGSNTFIDKPIARAHLLEVLRSSYRTASCFAEYVSMFRARNAVIHRSVNVSNFGQGSIEDTEFRCINYFKSWMPYH